MERIDDLQLNQLKIIQDTQKFCFGTDAVLLSNFAKVRKGGRVIDLGTGTAIIPILLSAKTKADSIVGVEIQPHMADLARRSVELNALEYKIKIVCADLKTAPELFGRGKFDLVVTNPPYLSPGGGLLGQNTAKDFSRHEIMCRLEDIVSVGAVLLNSGGRFSMIHRPWRLTDIICLMRQCCLEPKRLQFIHPSRDKPPNLILIEGIKNANSELKILPPKYM